MITSVRPKYAAHISALIRVPSACRFTSACRDTRAVTAATSPRAEARISAVSPSASGASTAGPACRASSASSSTSGVTRSSYLRNAAPRARAVEFRLVVRQYLQLGLRTLAYLDSDPEAADKPVLVLVHAFPLGALMWEPQLKGAFWGWRVLAPDLRGFGGSTDEREDGVAPSIDDYADDVAGLVREVVGAPVVLGGLSMGGYAAFAVMRRTSGTGPRAHPRRFPRQRRFARGPGRAQGDADAARARGPAGRGPRDDAEAAGRDDARPRTPTPRKRCAG